MNRWVLGLGGLLGLGAGMGCNPVAISKCHDEMNASQEAMLKIDTENLVEVESALAAVNRAHAACVAAERDDEVSKIADAQKKLMRQAEGLRELQDRPKTAPLSDDELAALAKAGDPDCPKGQQYEHHQNKQMIRCTGPQLVDMNWQQAKGHFERRGFSSIEKDTHLRLERGAKVYDYFFAEPNSKAGPKCLSVVPDPGVPWQEVVTRLTSVHPQKLALDKSVATKAGPMPLLVEGDSEHSTVKIGKCEPTPGQKRLEPEPSR